MTDFGGVDSFSGGLVQPNGRIVAVGSSNGMLIAGYASDGDPDVTFGENGSRVIVPGTGFAALYTVATQTSGKLVAAGQSVNATRDFAVGRFSADGELDATFGEAGFAMVDFGDVDAGNDMILLGDDHMIVAGYANNGDNDDLALAKLDADGALDDAFGTDGVLTLPVGTGNDRITAIALDPSGNFVAAGRTEDNERVRNPLAARFTADGDVDTSFGTGGVVVLANPGPDQANAVAALSDGSVLVAGSRRVNDESEMAVWKLDSTGALDSDFGSGGVAVIDFGPGFGSANALLVQGDGKILLAGAAADDGGVVAALARVDSGGVLDPEFDMDGKLTLKVGSADSDQVFGLEEQPDGKVVAFGWARNADLDALMIRFGL
jgi:uncharacterized delta-60 repeat protein